jgi:hypothetical protein
MPGMPITLERFERMLDLAQDPDWYDSVLDELTEGVKLRDYCKEHDLAYGRMLRWIYQDETRYAKYLAMEKLVAVRMQDEALEIADGSGEDAYRDKMKIDVRLKLAERFETRFRSAGSQVNVKGETVKISFADWENEDAKSTLIEGTQVAGREPGEVQRLSTNIDAETP